MGGRGATSASGGAFSTGDRSADKVISAAVNKYKNDVPKTKLTENVARRTLTKTNGDPIGAMKDKAKAMVASHKRDLREVANFKTDIARREKEIAKHAKELKKADKGSKVVEKRGVKTISKGDTYERLELAQSRREGALLQAHRDYGSRVNAVNNFKDNFAKEMDTLAKQSYRAYNYKKKKKR